MLFNADKKLEAPAFGAGRSMGQADDYKLPSAFYLKSFERLELCREKKEIPDEAINQLSTMLLDSSMHDNYRHFIENDRAQEQWDSIVNNIINIKVPGYIPGINSEQAKNTVVQQLYELKLLPPLPVLAALVHLIVSPLLNVSPFNIWGLKGKVEALMQSNDKLNALSRVFGFKIYLGMKFYSADDFKLQDKKGNFFDKYLERCEFLKNQKVGGQLIQLISTFNINKSNTKKIVSLISPEKQPDNFRNVLLNYALERLQDLERNDGLGVEDLEALLTQLNIMIEAERLRFKKTINEEDFDNIETIINFSQAALLNTIEKNKKISTNFPVGYFKDNNNAPYVEDELYDSEPEIITTHSSSKKAPPIAENSTDRSAGQKIEEESYDSEQKTNTIDTNAGQAPSTAENITDRSEGQRIEEDSSDSEKKTSTTDVNEGQAPSAAENITDTSAGQGSPQTHQSSTSKISATLKENKTDFQSATNEHLRQDSNSKRLFSGLLVLEKSSSGFMSMVVDKKSTPYVEHANNDGTTVQSYDQSYTGKLEAALGEGKVLRSTKSCTAKNGSSLVAVVDTHSSGKVINQTDNMKKMVQEDRKILALQQAKQCLERIDYTTPKTPVLIIKSKNSKEAQELHAAILLLSKKMNRSVQIKNFASNGPEKGFFGMTKDTAYIKEHLPNCNSKDLVQVMADEANALIAAEQNIKSNSVQVALSYKQLVNFDEKGVISEINEENQDENQSNRANHP